MVLLYKLLPKVHQQTTFTHRWINATETEQLRLIILNYINQIKIQLHFVSQVLTSVLYQLVLLWDRSSFFNLHLLFDNLFWCSESFKLICNPSLHNSLFSLVWNSSDVMLLKGWFVLILFLWDLEPPTGISWCYLSSCKRRRNFLCLIRGSNNSQINEGICGLFSQTCDFLLCACLLRLSSWISPLSLQKHLQQFRNLKI